MLDYQKIKKTNFVGNYFNGILVIAFLSMIVVTTWYMVELSKPGELNDQLDNEYLDRIYLTVDYFSTQNVRQKY